MQKTIIKSKSCKTYGLLASTFCMVSGLMSGQANAESFFVPEIFDTGNAISILVSSFALIGSIYSFYMTVLRRAKIDAFVAPVIQFQSYQVRGGGFTEYFNIPLTTVNSGARSATILSVTLEVTNPRLKQARYYYPMAVGSFKDLINGKASSFTPLSINGRQSQSAHLIFDRKPGQDDTPQQIDNNIRHVEVAGGTFDFNLHLEVISAGRTYVKVVPFNMNIGPLDYRRFENGGSIPMYNNNFPLLPEAR